MTRKQWWHERATEVGKGRVCLYSLSVVPPTRVSYEMVRRASGGEVNCYESLVIPVTSRNKDNCMG